MLRPADGRSRHCAVVVALVMAIVSTLQPVGAEPASAAVVLPGFQASTIFGGHRFDTPTAIAFGGDDRIFVTERAGRILEFDGIADSTPTVVADLSTRVHAVADRGLLGLAVHPDFPSAPYIYVTYILDAPVGGSPVPFYNDQCPPSPNGAHDGCPAPGRLSRIQVGADSRMIGSEEIIIGGQFWCHPQPGHALDHVAFGPDGALYVSSGEGSNGSIQDYGQHSGATAGVPSNACGDPPAAVGERLRLPTTEGGALRSQDLRTPSDPTTGNGAIIRVDPATGAAMPDNPLVGNAVGDDDRHIAFGLRNPYRFTFRPGTSEVWITDVGWNAWEETNVLPSPADAVVENFGWPCYEGAPRNDQWDNVNVEMCEDLYADGPATVTSPFWAYRHSQSPDPGRCGSAGSAATGIAFSEGAPFPDEYNGALFVADYVKGCLWVLRAGSNGLPDPARLQTVLTDVAPVDVEIGPDGRLYYVDILAGTANRVDYFAGNEPPVARVIATPTSGPTPLAVTFDATGSTDDQPTSQLDVAWDLDGDGAFDDATGMAAQRTYTVSGKVRAGLRVTDDAGASSTAHVDIQAGNNPPDATILVPTTAVQWMAGQNLAFAGSASDAEEPGMGPESMRWSIVLHHCATPTDCHEHPQADVVGVASGTFDAPDHSFPAFLEFRLTVTDAQGLTDTASVRVDPRTVELQFVSEPAGLTLAAGTATGTSSVGVTAIAGSRLVVTAPTPQSLGGAAYRFTSWSDGGAASHDIVVGTADAIYVARYEADQPPSPPPKPPASVVRLAGADRYATAAAVSAGSFLSADRVYVATGRNFPDALAAAAAAGAAHGSVLLVEPDRIPAATSAELQRLQPSTIVIAGGSGVVSSGVEQQLVR